MINVKILFRRFFMRLILFSGTKLEVESGRKLEEKALLSMGQTLVQPSQIGRGYCGSQL